MTHTAEDLKIGSALPLERKVGIAQTRIQEAILKTEGEFFVAFSGGKDSTVLLDLVARVARTLGSSVNVAFVDTGLEFPEVKNNIKNMTEFVVEKHKCDIHLDVLRPKIGFKQVIEEYGWTFPSKAIATKIYDARRGSVHANRLFNGLNGKRGGADVFAQTYAKWKHLLDAPFKISHKCCLITKERPAKAYRTATKRLPMLGSMAAESGRRRTAWLKTGCNSFDGKDAVSKPMSLWRDSDVLEYTKRFNLPLASVYGDIVQGKDGKYKTTGMSRTGCMFCPVGCHLDKVPRFKKMQLTHPKQWEFCMRDEESGGLGLGKFLDYLGIEYKN